LRSTCCSSPAGAPTAREIELQRVSELETSRRVVLEERATIARDLHDSVAHHVNLMVIQAETGPDVVARGGEEVLRVFRLIGDTGRRALAELDRTLALLRDDSGALLAPQPGLDDLEQLVRDTTAPGLTVELIVDGDRRPLDSGIELAAYRIVQESLTNVIRHAGADSASVSVRYEDARVVVEVTDTGRGDRDRDSPAAGSGNGIVGMRERVLALGGEFEAGPRRDGGFRVRAWLPLAAQT
jgi:signal transduction histidine kinase